MKKALILSEGQKGNGYRHSRFAHALRPKFHDLKFIGGAPLPFDWQAGYDVEVELGKVLENPSFKLPVKDQGQSSSCGGQTASTLESINETFLRNYFTERSAKDAYSHIFYRMGGTDSPRVINLMKNRGIASETLVWSYQNGTPPTEDFMRQVDDSQNVSQDALATIDDKAVSVDFTNIDSIAQALRDCKGLALALEGQNNGTWLSAFPKPPIDGTNLWGHFITIVKAKLINGRKFIGILNSWGKDCGEQGIQWLGEEYVTSGHLKDCFGIVDNSFLQPLVKQDAISGMLLILQLCTFQLRRMLDMIKDGFYGAFSKRID